jgi:RND family efflux transporter MFP subunit
MRFTILFLTLLLLTGCQNHPESGPPATSSPHAEHSDHAPTEDGHDDHNDPAPTEGDHDGHDDHDEHSEKEGFLELTPAQKEQLNVTTKPVVAVGGQSTGLRPGRIEADPDRRVLISSQVQGTLQNIYVQVGDTIDAGASVAVIASPEVTSLQTDYHEAEVEAELARKELANKNELFLVSDEIYQPMETAKLEVAEAKAQRDAAAAQLQSTVLKNERLETLLRDGIASKQQVEESRADRKALEARLVQAETALKIAEGHLKRERRVSQSQLNIKAETFPAEARLSRATEQMRHAKERLHQLGASPEAHSGLIVVSSPIAGTVVERVSSRGELVTPSEPIAVVVDFSTVWVWVDLQRSDLDLIDKGDPIELSLVERPDRTARGDVDYIAPQLDEKTQTLRARVVLADPPQGFQLGAFVNARVSNGSSDSAPAVPQQSVQFVEGQNVVYVREGEGYRRTPVTLGASVGDALVAVTGVKIGDQVVINGVEQLKSLDLSDKIGGHSH